MSVALSFQEIEGRIRALVFRGQVLPLCAQDHSLGDILACELRSGRENFRLQEGSRLLNSPTVRANGARLELSFSEEPTGGKYWRKGRVSSTL